MYLGGGGPKKLSLEEAGCGCDAPICSFGGRKSKGATCGTQPVACC